MQQCFFMLKPYDMTCDNICFRPLHWEGCSWDWHSYTFQDIYSACQVDLLNCLNTHYLKTENADWTSSKHSFYTLLKHLVTTEFSIVIINLKSISNNLHKSQKIVEKTIVVLVDLVN